MTHDLLISYSTQDKPIADAICHHLEKDGVRCWIAPRDIIAGQDWPGAVVTALQNVQIVVFVCSEISNTSPQVVRDKTLRRVSAKQ